MLGVFAAEDDGSDRDDTENNDEVDHASMGRTTALVPAMQQYTTPMRAALPLVLRASLKLTSRTPPPSSDIRYLLTYLLYLLQPGFLCSK